MTSACGAGWRNIPVSNQGSLTPRQETQVWVHGAGPLRLKQLHWTPDSVFGKPYLASLDGDTTTVGVPRARVDSIRVGNPTSGFLKSAGLGLGIAAGLAILLCIAGGCPSES